MATTKKYAGGGLAEALQTKRKGMHERGTGYPTAPLPFMQAGANKLVDKLDSKLNEHVAKNKAAAGATQTAESHKRGGRVGEPNRPQKTIRASAGGTVLSSGKTVDSTHSHLMKQGKAMGYR